MSDSHTFDHGNSTLLLIEILGNYRALGKTHLISQCCCAQHVVHLFVRVFSMFATQIIMRVHFAHVMLRVSAGVPFEHSKFNFCAVCVIKVLTEYINTFSPDLLNLAVCYRTQHHRSGADLRLHMCFKSFQTSLETNNRTHIASMFHEVCNGMILRQGCTVPCLIEHVFSSVRDHWLGNWLIALTGLLAKLAGWLAGWAD